MSSKKQSYLEPIEEDVSLEEKFKGIDASKLQKQEKKESEKEDNKEDNKEESLSSSVIKNKEDLKEGLVESENIYDKILSQISPQDSKKNISNDESVKSDAQITNAKIDAESKISHLIELAQSKGIFYAVKVARHLKDNYILDELHDKMLGEEFYQVLVKKGMIKEI